MTQTLTVPAAWPALPAALEANAVTEAQRDYASVRSTYMAVGAPVVVVRPDSDELASLVTPYAAAVRDRVGERVPFSVRSGGHGIAGTGTNTGGVVLDLSLMREVELLDPESGLVRVQAGATWGDVAPVLAAHDLVLTSGNMGDTGVGGLATAGGVGYFARAHGLTLDRVLRVKVLGADGHVRWVDGEHEPDVFWAVRGGAAQAGVALEFDFRAERIGSARGDASIVHHTVQYLADDVVAFTQVWGDWIAQAPREAESFLTLQALGDGRTVVQAKTVWANDDVEAARPVLQASLDLAPVLQQQAQVVPYPSIVPAPRWRHTGQQTIVMRDVLVDESDATLGAALAASLEHPATAVAELRSLGGAVSDVPAGDTAWAGRSQQVLAATWIHPGAMQAMDDSFAPIEALGTGMYGAYSSDTRPTAAALAWPGATGERLRAVSDRVDPLRIFDRGLVVSASD